ncbi:condensation domain-containing protein, partial [Paraburkholderia aspalathi]|uniref:condensation domain-containing protein n=1 Tax=Paraburkholderia aspalathi TaxID=1324617 RepID=UPI0038B79015
AITLIERLRQQGRGLEVRSLFEHPSLQGLAQAVDNAQARGVREVPVPPNGIEPGCERITPEMLSLVSLTQEEIEQISAGVRGGAGNIQDIYPLGPLQEGILYHHRLQQQGDAYLTPTLLAFDTRAQLDRFAVALNRVIARHDILRTAVQWEGLGEPVQVVWRQARFELEELAFSETGEDGEGGGVQSQLAAFADPARLRLDVRQAPMLRGLVTYEASQQRWLLQLLHHHLIMDHTTLEAVVWELGLIDHDQDALLPEPLPFRNFVAQARLGVSQAEHDAFFREMLGDVNEPSVPFGLHDIRADGTQVQEARQMVAPALARRVRRQAQQQGVSAASVFHLAYAQVLAKGTGQDDVVFGTVLFGRMQGGAGADRALGMFINTLPVRVKLGMQTAREALQATQRQLNGLMGHEHAMLARAQRCSGLESGTPLFSALLNYRYSQAPGEASNNEGGFEGLTVLGGEERTNYPFSLSVDDLGEDFALTSHIDRSIGAERICEFMHTALEQLVQALESGGQGAVSTLAILPP